MNPFLKEVAQYLYDNYAQRLDSCALVFPNRRAALFFSRHLSSLIEKPVWSPRIYTISELMGELSGMEQADPILLNFRLYSIYRQVTGSRESFDKFYGWGEVLLSDFDEIDKYMVDAGALFKNVAGLKEIDNVFDFLSENQRDIIKNFWKNFAGEYSQEQREFLYIWEALSGIYEKFTESLASSNIAYEGMMYRKVAGGIKKREEPKLEYERYFIAGFNALTPCEKELFKYLQKRGKAAFFWDYDRYYTSGGDHRAGLFMRQNLKDFPPADFSHDPEKMAKSNPKVTVVSAPGNTAQAKLTGLLPGLFGTEEELQTAVVLPDEELLVPLLSSLPQKVGEINVTMGYPLKDTAVFSFIMHLLSLSKNSRVRENKTEFYHRDVLSLLNHPCFRRHGAERVREKTDRIVRENMIYVEQKELAEPGLPEMVFQSTSGVGEYIDRLLNILVFLSEGETGENEEEDSGGIPGNEIIYRLYTGVNRLGEVLKTAGMEIGFPTFVKLLKKVLFSMRIPFYGEPLKGVQVMGVLETRTLDFRHLIWLSMNEGVFPARSQSSSFIPYNLRKAFGLPLDEDYDAVYAYYFYRLLHSAEKVTLVYNSRGDGLFTGEKSRFIHQLKHNDRFSVEEKDLAVRVHPVTSKPVVIEKSDDILRRLQGYTSNAARPHSLSPSSVNTYIDCSLKFYFRYVAGLPETEKVEGEVDPALFGSLLHDAAYRLYEPFKGKVVEGSRLEEIEKDDKLLSDTVRYAFSKVFFGERESKPEPEGRNLVISQVLQKYLRQLLRRDRELAPFTVVGLEQYCTMYLDAGQGTGKVKLGGVIDRVDRVNGVARVADYKTGGDDTGFKDIDSLFEEGDPRRNKSVFQLFLYSLIYGSSLDGDYRISPALYRVKKLFGNDPFTVAEKTGRSARKEVTDFSLYAGDFEKRLKETLSALFDPAKPFEQAADTQICSFCPYTGICHR